MAPDFELMSRCLSIIVSFPLAIGYVVVTKARTPVHVDMMISTIYTYTWVTFVHAPMTRKLERMYQRSLIRSNPQLKHICRDIILGRPNPQVDNRCTLCRERRSVGGKLFIQHEYERGRRYRIYHGWRAVNPTLSGYDVFLCGDCHFCIDILFDTLKSLLEKRQRLVKHANLVRSLMMQRFFRRRLGNDLSGKIMTFVCWTPEVEIL